MTTSSLRHYVSPVRFWRDIRRYRLAYLFILPCFLLMMAIHFIPVAQGIYMSRLWLTKETLKDYLGAPVVGDYNYRFSLNILDMERDCGKPPTENGQKMCELIIKKKEAGRDANPITSGLIDATRNTIVYAIFVNAGNILLGVLGAQLLNRQFYGRRLARTLMLLPWVVPTFAVGMLWGFMFKQEEGIINKILVEWLGLLASKPAWLRGENVMVAIIIPTVWRQLPFNIIMFLAALQVVPSELYEAASIDGAGAWQRFRKITVPYLKPVLAIVLMWGIIFTVFGYNIVVMMFNNPASYAGEYGDILMPFIQRQSWNMSLFGQGAATAVMMMSGMLVFIATWYFLFRETLTQEN